MLAENKGRIIMETARVIELADEKTTEAIRNYLAGLTAGIKVSDEILAEYREGKKPEETK